MSTNTTILETAEKLAAMGPPRKGTVLEIQQAAQLLAAQAAEDAS